MAIRPWGLPAALLLPFLLSACVARVGPPRMEFALGTVCVVNLFDGGTDDIYSEVFSRIREIDRTMTAFPATVDGGPDSPVVEIGRQAGIAPVRVGADLIQVLERALHFARISDGAFDPTIGPLTGLWGIGTHTQRVPEQTEIAAALDLVDWRDLVIDRDAGTVFLRRRGMSLDLGSIAKGYAGDEVARIAREAGLGHALIDLGGNIVLVGRRWRGRADEPWRIGVRNPIEGRDAHLGVLEVYDTSVVTSGVNERFFEIPGPDGTGGRFHHLLCTLDGFPVSNGLLSVTVVTGSSTDADALSTAAFALGYERGRALVDSMPGFEAIFVFDDRRVKITDGLVGVFRLTDDGFSLAGHP